MVTVSTDCIGIRYPAVSSVQLPMALFFLVTLNGSFGGGTHVESDIFTAALFSVSLVFSPVVRGTVKDHKGYIDVQGDGIKAASRRRIGGATKSDIF